MTWMKKFWIVETGVIYIVHLIFNALSATAGPDNKLFPNTVGNVSRHFDNLITPVSGTFAIWSAIFIFQILWMIYAIVNIFRQGPTVDILSNSFFIAFNINIVFITAWLFTWSRKQEVASFVIIVLGQIAFDFAAGFALYSLKKFLDENPEFSTGNVDVWIQRILVPNALLFYGTWTTIATHINFNIVLVFQLNVAQQTASIIALSLLGFLLLVWFIVENFVLTNAAQYTFSAYIVLIIGVNGVFLNGIFDSDKIVGGLTLALLILSSFFLIVRLVIILWRHKNRKESEVV